MPPASLDTLPRFASLPSIANYAPRPRRRLSDFFLAPFRDVDDRAARKAAAAQAERVQREAAMAGAVGQRR
jgi:hypothetical protein